MKGAYFRLLEDKSAGDEVVEYRSGEKSESLIVDGDQYGHFSVFVFVLRDRSSVRNYVEKSHPIVITLNGQNHGEIAADILADAHARKYRLVQLSKLGWIISMKRLSATSSQTHASIRKTRHLPER